MDYLFPFFSQMIEGVFSSHFLYLVVMGMLLLYVKLSDRQFNILLYLSSFAYFLLFYGKYLNIFRMAGDNICQIAYWKILFHPNLTGSIGASYTKPGQLLILGSLYELSEVFGETAFRVGICLVMAGCIWILARIATDIGGRGAGLIAFMTSSWVFFPEFKAGSFSIFLIPTLFIGFWLYFQQLEHKTLGRILLASSVQFHIQAAPVLGVIWLWLAWNRAWKELGRFTLTVTCSLTIWLLLILRVQGAVNRVSSSGLAVGYIGSIGDPFTYDSKLEYLLKAIWSELAGSYTYAGLFVLIAIGAVGAYYYRYLHYLGILSTVALLIANVFLFNGTLNLNRHFAICYAFGCSVGVGSLIRFVKDRAQGKNAFPKYCIATWLFLMTAVSAYVIIKAKQESNPVIPPYVKSASYLLTDRHLPFATRLMTEDDLLFPAVINAPTRFPVLATLQQFNTADAAKRKTMLGKTDFIWIALTGEHQYYYLNYLSVPEWRSDQFRQMIDTIVKTNSAGLLYGYRFLPVDKNSERLLLRVMPTGTE